MTDMAPGGAATEAAVMPARHLTEDEAIRLGTDIQRRVGIKTSRREPLARFSTMRVGGPADLFAEVHNLFELRALVRLVRSRGIPYFVLGRGSNLVISDRGIAGLVILNRAAQVSVDGNLFTADSGLPMAKAATLAKEAALSGLEFGLAIPGTVGGAVWANAGAHDSDVRAVLVEAAVLRSDGEATATAEALGLAYRESALKHARPDAPDVVTWARFRLQSAAAEVISGRLDEIRRWRQATQPLGIPSAGSVFRNPPDGPSAGRLIDELGLKGRREGGATVSEKHANFIVNDRAGSASDVRRLVETVQLTVRRERGVELVPEIVFAGDWSDWEPAA